jgi:tetratricopeptide (TPR) repeat protein
MSDAMTNHSDTESLAAFVDGRLGREEREAVVKHLQTCEECQGFVREAAAFEQEEAAARKPGRTWWAAAATVAMVAVGIGSVSLRPRFDAWRYRAAIEPMVVFMELIERPIAPRLDGFGWSPERRITRGETDPTLLKVVAQGVLEKVPEPASAVELRAAGVAHLLKGEVSEAIASLTAAIWSDLAAARYIAATRSDSPDFSSALEAADRALELDDDLPVALFNRALILERMGPVEKARGAWQRYLEIDRQSPWANDARKHLEKL